MKKILKMQILKLFYNGEYTGYNIIGSLLVFVYGWGYSAVFLENKTVTPQETMMRMVEYTFPALIIFTICLFGYTYVKEFQNKTIYYEKIHDMKVSQILLGRCIVPLMNSCIFCIVLLMCQITCGILYNYLSHDVGMMLLEKSFFSFIIVLHLNIIVGAYFFILPDILAGSIFSFILQWFVPSVLIPGITENRILFNSFCCNQFIFIWEGNSINSLLLKQIIVTFLAECITLYFIVYWYYRRKDWN